MPPRTPLVQSLRAQIVPRISTASHPFSSAPSSQASTVTQRRRRRDPYAIAQAKARRAANLSRQEVLREERAAVLGDPVRGVTTPFVRSFDTAQLPETSSSSASATTGGHGLPLKDVSGPRIETDDYLNFFLTQDELAAGVKRSRWLTEPLQVEQKDKNSSVAKAGHEAVASPGVEAEISQLLDSYEQRTRPDYGRAKNMMDNLTGNETPAERKTRLQEEHDTAQEAVRRISSLSLSNSKGRLRANIQRCIDVFGRHNTDQALPAKADPLQTSESALQKFPRVGPDTGSSEVQVAILTAKIRTLADSLELRGHPDKMNKRNLRLLVHRRAKLLKYLRRKERGGPRWQNIVDKLGVTDSMWKGEISL